MKRMLLLFLILAAGPATAGELETVLSSYRKAEAVSMKFNKASVNEIFGTERTAAGKLMLRSGLMRMETEGAEKSLLIMDGKTIWFVQSMDNGGDSPSTVVNKGSAENLQKSNAVVAVLFDSRKLLKVFRIDKVEKVKVGKQSGARVFTLSPRKKNSSDVQKLEISAKDRQILRVTFWDARQNKTTYSFSEVDFKAKLSANEFAYSPPKDAEVMEY